MTNKKAAERQSLAEQALNNADNEALKRLYDDAEKDLQTMVSGLAVMCRSGETKTLPSHDKSVVEAMRDVALASIELAKIIATQKNK